MSNKKGEEEFKPNVIEPIEGQMCYDELLTPEKQEEKAEVDNSMAQGQMDFWSIDPRKSEIIDVKKEKSVSKPISKKTEKLIIQESFNEEIEEGEEIENPSSSAGKGSGNNGAGSGNGSGDGHGILFKPLEDVLHESMIPYTESVVMDRALPRVEDGLKPVQKIGRAHV